MNIFVAVYQNRSITRAARELHLAQPSVSLAIRELEEFYKIRLFDRISRRIYPTESGHRFYEYALHIVSLFDELETGIPNWEAAASLRVGSSITLGNCLLPSLVRRFRDSHPGVRVRVSIRNTETIEQQVLDNQVDFALVEGSVTHPELLAEAFFNDRLCLVASPSHPLAALPRITLPMAAQYDLLLREPGSAGREIAESLFYARELPLSPAWESVSNQALIRAAREGLGIAILPWLLVNEEIQRGRLAELSLSEPMLQRSLFLIRHRNKYLPQPALEFMELIRQFSHAEGKV
ncbi:MAG: LysR family transcriptional regulator [Eubacteriales bacterium]|nr:LysR family transcriptional regulator [Eubacteriales bacterium]